MLPRRLSVRRRGLASAATVAVSGVPGACQRQRVALFHEARSVKHGSRFMVERLPFRRRFLRDLSARFTVVVSVLA
jgi:hypothetical protein